MTRLEQLERKIAADEANLALERAARAKLKEQRKAKEQRAETKARTARQIRVGKLVDDAGLFAWEDSTLTGLFAVLARLTETPNPVALLAGLVEDHTGVAVVPAGTARPTKIEAAQIGVSLREMTGSLGDERNTPGTSALSADGL